MAAVRLVDFARRGISAANQARNSMMENVAEYLLEENPTLVRQQNAQDFGAEVSALRDDVERLAKRIERLQGRI
jgi:ubiquinone biosynthesis protein UbiJ